MNLRFYAHHHGVITDFLLRQLECLGKEIPNLQITVDDLGLFEMLEVEGYKEQIGTCEDLELTHYTYIFTTENDIPLACCNKPLDYIELKNITDTLMGKFQ